MRTPFLPTLLLLPFLAGPALGDKVIMKSGKIYEGRIMGESHRSILVRTEAGAKPIFLRMDDVHTIVRDPQPPEAPSEEAGRFASVEFLVSGNAFRSGSLDFDAAPGFHLGGGFRLHPAFELGAVLDLWPGLNGEVSVGDQQSGAVRSYEHFYAYAGGFQAKFFPLFRRRYARAEPFLLGGIAWNRVAPKASGDHFSGTSWKTGVGVSWAWFKPVYVESRFVYQNPHFTKVQFQSGEGDITGVQQDVWTAALGLSYRFL